LLNENLDVVLKNYGLISDFKGLVKETGLDLFPNYQKPAWIDSPLEPSELSSVIQGSQTSTLVRTGLWRTQRPVIDYGNCHKCWWVCSSFCPDSAITIGKDGFPLIDYEHCKGCMICVAQCPSHAIATIPEVEAQRLEHQGEQK